MRRGRGGEEHGAPLVGAGGGQAARPSTVGPGRAGAPFGARAAIRGERRPPRGRAVDLRGALGGAPAGHGGEPSDALRGLLRRALRHALR
eukprot:1011443-Prorocentrum_minimum.AAC.1